MGTIIGVQFQKNGKLYYFDANGFQVKPGEYVIVDTVRGYDLGEVVLGPRETTEEETNPGLKKTIRIATEQDIQHAMENREKEKEAFTVCQKKIAEHKLEMKLVSVEFAFDNSKILFYFTANGRVDFRSLVKDLASIFKMRIELRQIGVRDEAKMLGGLGPCGRPICCGSFLEQFQPVSIKMAKEQNLSLNPTKISGVCGRLMCCLKYEQEHYETTRKKMPKIGREVITPDGNGPVTELNILKETVFVRLTNGDTSEIREYPLEAITRPGETHTHSESARKTSEKEPEYTAIDAKWRGEAESSPDSVAVAEQKGTDSVPSDEPTGTADEKYRIRRGKGTLGQPVRRQNPNRTDERTQEAATAKQPDKPDKEEPKNPKSPWADAVQKAMQAIGQNK